MHYSEPPDFRFAKSGPKGIKPTKTREYCTVSVAKDENDDEPGVSGQDTMDLDENQPSKRVRAEGKAYRTVSGKVWKGSSQRASSISKNTATPWQRKMTEKATQQQFLEYKRVAVGASKEKRKAEGERRRLVRERKKENQAKSTVVQKLSTATAKKMMKSKKQRKLLKTADTN